MKLFNNRVIQQTLPFKVGDIVRWRCQYEGHPQNNLPAEVVAIRQSLYDYTVRLSNGELMPCLAHELYPADNSKLD